MHFRLALAVMAGLLAAAYGGSARAACTVPYTFQNGTIADANQVNSNYAAIRGCFPAGAAVGTTDVQTITNKTVSGSGTNIAAHVPTNAALILSSTVTYPNGVWRDDHSASFGAPRLFYRPSLSACTLNAGSGDNGSQVASSDSKCWIASFDGLADIREWGCAPNASQDVVPCISAATTANVGVPIFLPQGVYEVQTAATFSSKVARIIGTSNWGEFKNTHTCPTLNNVQGTWLHRANTSAAIIPFTYSYLEGNAGFDGIAFCEDHPTPTGGWSPTIYQPWFFLDAAASIDFTNLYVYAVYQFLTSSGSTDNVGRTRMSNVRGQPFKNFMTLDKSLDVTHLSDFHLWPYWSFDTHVTDWTQANGDAFILGRVDGFTAPDVFLYGYRSGVKFTSTASGVTNGANFPAFYCDATKYCIWNNGANGATAQFGNAFLTGGFLAGSNGIQIDSTSAGSMIQIGQLHCAVFGGGCVNNSGSAGSNQVMIGNVWGHDYNQDNNGSAFFTASANNYIKLATAPAIGASTYAGPVIPTGTPAGYYCMPGQFALTPGVKGGTVAGNFTYNNTLTTGWWGFDCSTVTARIEVHLATTDGTATGTATVTGLPYTAMVPAINPGTCRISYGDGVTFGAGYVILDGQVIANTKTVQIFQSGPTATPQSLALPIGDISGTTGLFSMDCTYRVF